MAAEFCVPCKINSKKKCAQCARVKVKPVVHATHGYNLPPSLLFMGVLFTPEGDEEHY